MDETVIAYPKNSSDTTFATNDTRGLGNIHITKKNNC